MENISLVARSSNRKQKLKHEISFWKKDRISRNLYNIIKKSSVHFAPSRAKEKVKSVNKDEFILFLRIASLSLR